jgi:hypothetical protein
MMRWSDLGAALRVSPRVLLRLDLWLGVLRRALFSRVFVGYVLASFMLFMAGRQVVLALQAPSSGLNNPYVIAILIAIGMVASVLVYLLAVLLLPYCYWAFNPVAARLLPDYLELPPALDEEPWFGAYLWWTLPVLGATVLYFGLMLLPVRSAALQGIAIALQLLAIINLFARSALAAFFAPTDIDRFLHATRWQRRLVWLPIVVGTGWLVQLLMAQWIQWQAIAAVFSDLLLGAGMVGIVLAGVAQMAIALLISFVISAFFATVFVAALLLVCSRMMTPAATGGPASSSLHSITMPYPPEPARQASRAGFGRAWRRVAALAIVVTGGAYFARMPLVDWYLSSQESYLNAPATLKAQGHGFDASDRQGRLTAGYIVAGCYGDIDRMRWLRRIGLDRAQADPVALACAACEGKFEAVRWMLAQDEALRPNDVILRSDGYAKRTGSALSCAAIRGETGVVEALLARGAKPALLGPRASAVNMAAFRQDWTMVSMLLHADAGAAGLAIFSALDGARVQAAQALPHMLAAGLSLNVRDEFHRSVFHWAAMRHDLALARALMEHAAGLPAEVGPAGADLQGALPWMHVLRTAELHRRPLSADAAELLRLLLPPQVDANAQAGRSPVSRDDVLPEGWSARDAVLNDPVAGEVLSAAFDIGRLPADPEKWWRFNSAEAAEWFVRRASKTQLMRAENPDAPEGMEPRKLSTALAEAGWPELAKEVTLAVKGQRR